MRITRLMFHAAGYLALVSAAACSSMGEYRSAGSRIPEGATVELTRTLPFLGRSTRAYIQFGETLRGRGDVNEWEPYCSFGLDRRRDGEALVREVGPTTFEVTQSQVGVDVALSPGDAQDDAKDDAKDDGLINDREIVVAGAFGGGAGPSGTPSFHIYYMSLQLYSSQQPQVDDLTCAYRGSSVDRYLTVDEVRSTLGGIARIN